jgi:hypothetical protein
MAHFTEASLEIILAFNFQVKKQDIKSFGFSSEVKICNLPMKRVLLCTKLKVRKFLRPLKCRYELKICLYFM